MSEPLVLHPSDTIAVLTERAKVGEDPLGLGVPLAAPVPSGCGVRLAVRGVQERHFYSRINFKLNRAAAVAEWRQLLSA